MTNSLAKSWTFYLRFLRLHVRFPAANGMLVAIRQAIPVATSRSEPRPEQMEATAQ